MFHVHLKRMYILLLWGENALRISIESIWSSVTLKAPVSLLHCWWECRLVQPLWKVVWRYLKKLNMELPYDPVMLLLGIFPKKPETLIQRNIHCSIIYNSQYMEATQVPINRWVDKKAVKYLCNRISAIKKEWNITLCNSIDGPGEQCSNLIPLATNHTPPG